MKTLLSLGMVTPKFINCDIGRQKFSKLVRSKQKQKHVIKVRRAKRSSIV